MFDGGYLGIDPRYRLQVSPQLRVEFANGYKFYARAGQVIALPPTGATARPVSSSSGTSTRSSWHHDHR